MGDDGVGAIACFPQFKRLAKGRLAADGLGLEVADPGVDLPAGAPARAVADESDPLPFRDPDVAHDERGDLMAPGNQRRGQMLELAGEVLVDEEEVHVWSYTRLKDFFTYSTRAIKTAPGFWVQILSKGAHRKTFNALLKAPAPSAAPIWCAPALP